LSKHRNPLPVCEGKLKDDSLCTTYAQKGETLCAYHLRLRDKARVAEVELTEESLVEQEPQEVVVLNGARKRPTNIRQQLAEDTLDEYEVLRGALLDALKAQKETFSTCCHCNKRSPVTVPDYTARVKAVETLMNQGFGKPADPPKGKLDMEALRIIATEAMGKGKPIEDMTDDELYAIIAFEHVSSASNSGNDRSDTPAPRS
jgi:hypothetical protein